MSRKIVLQVSKKVVSKLTSELYERMQQESDKTIVKDVTMLEIEDLKHDSYELHLEGYGVGSNITEEDIEQQAKQFDMTLSREMIKTMQRKMSDTTLVITIEKKDLLIHIQAKLNNEVGYMLDLIYDSQTKLITKEKGYLFEPSTLLYKHMSKEERENHAVYTIGTINYISRTMLTYIEQPTNMVEVEHTKQKIQQKSKSKKSGKKSNVRYIYKTVYKIRGMGKNISHGRKHSLDREYVKAEWERKGHVRKYYDKDTGELKKEVWIPSTKCKAKKIKGVSEMRITRI